MGQRRREFNAFSDVVIALLAYLFVVRWHLGPWNTLANWYIQLVPVIVGLWWFLSATVRRDVPYRLGGVADEIRDTVVLNAVGAVLLLALSLLTKHLTVSRLALAGFPILSSVLAIALRLAVRSVLGGWRRRGHDTREVLLAGPAGSSLNVAGQLFRRDSGLRLVGVLLPEGTAAPADYPLPVLGPYARLPEVLHSRVVDQIILAMPVDDPGFRLLVEAAMREGKGLYWVLDPFGARLVGHGSSAGHLVALAPGPDPTALAVKRTLDVVFSAAALLVAIPVLAVCAAAIKFEDPSAPVLFRQRRIGRHGRPFTCYKLRTMVPEAEQLRAGLAEHNEMDGPVFKMRHDPRITQVGRVLRKYSLDEIPQFWNVLRGDMSLVGPRPPLPDEVQRYAPEFRRRLAFRPGLTCLWQVSGRNRVDFQSWMELDLAYVDNWSVGLDLQLLLRTIPTVFSGSGM